MTDVGGLLRRRRELAGLSQEEVVARANDRAGKQVVSLASIGIFERGLKDIYRARTLYGFELGYDLPVGTIERLLAGDDLADTPAAPSTLEALQAEVAESKAVTEKLLREVAELRAQLAQMDTGRGGRPAQP